MRTIVEAARIILHSKDLERKFWAEAVNTAVYVLNRTGSSPVAGRSPYELWHNKKPQFENFRIFGSEVFIHVPKEKRAKWDRKAEKGIFIGYAEETKGYPVWNTTKNKVEIAIDVVF